MGIINASKELSWSDPSHATLFSPSLAEDHQTPPIPATRLAAYRCRVIRQRYEQVSSYLLLTFSRRIASPGSE